MTAPRDPLGKQALFSVASEHTDDETNGTAPPLRKPGGVDGKAALYSTAVRRPGTLVLECSACHGLSRVSYVEFARRHLPVWLWLPWRRHSRFMACPACGRRAWLAARWLE